MSYVSMAVSRLFKVKDLAAFKATLAGMACPVEVTVHTAPYEDYVSLRSPDGHWPETILPPGSIGDKPRPEDGFMQYISDELEDDHIAVLQRIEITDDRQVKVKGEITYIRSAASDATVDAEGVERVTMRPLDQVLEHDVDQYIDIVGAGIEANSSHADKYIA